MAITKPLITKKISTPNRPVMVRPLPAPSIVPLFCTVVPVSVRSPLASVTLPV